MTTSARFLLGADPEAFCIDETGKYISAVGKFGGTKEQPKPLSKEGFFIQEDNVAVEFNIPPAKSEDEFVSNIQFALTEVENAARAENLFLSITASCSFTPDQLRDPSALHFGCEPDYNAWTFARNPKPRSRDRNLRSCGGHLHFGWNDYFRTPWYFVRWLDLFQACPAILVDKDVKRRELYGKAGAFRKKSYGVEYRTLSNFWLSSKNHIRWAYKTANQAVDAFDAAPDYSLDEYKDIIFKCIHKNDLTSYELLASKFPLITPPDL